MLGRLNPRLHLAAAIGWAVFSVVTLAAWLTAGFAAAQAEDRARVDAQVLLAEFATQVRDALSLNLEARRSLLTATAAQMAVAVDRSTPAVARRLEAMQAQFPEFAWLAVADASGHLVVATDGAAAGADVSGRAWFQRGRQAASIGDRPAAAVTASPNAAAQAGRLLELGVPLEDSSPGVVLGAGLAWPWVEQQAQRMQSAFSQSRRLELMLAARDGTVVFGPAAWLGRRLDDGPDVTEGGRFVSGRRTELRLADNLGLGWTAIVRQRADEALAPVRLLRHTVFVTVFVAGLLSAAAAVLAVRWLVARLGRLARDAEAVRRGELRTLAVPAGADEVSRIGATLAEVVDHLQTEKQSLQTLNRELDQRVAERTQRIERLAGEARQAAVTRERLRIARDLHDTLAQSLMSLLTQMRLVRKLHARMSPADLDAELTRAEAVATDGLAQARAAIGQMRDHGVLEAGLAAALQDLGQRVAQRSGMTVELAIDPAVDPAVTGASDMRAQTVFRIVEEALRNVERHAGAQQVRLGLHALPRSGADSPERIELEVTDDGAGFDPDAPRSGHFGLLGMHEQAALIDAEFAVASQPGHGTRITLRLDA